MRSSVCCGSTGSIATNFQESESCAPFLADRDRIKNMTSRVVVPEESQPQRKFAEVSIR